MVERSFEDHVPSPVPSPRGRSLCSLLFSGSVQVLQLCLGLFSGSCFFFNFIFYFLCFILVLLWQQCRRYKRLCPFCPQNPLKKLPGHFTTLKDLSKSVINPGGCRPLAPLTLTQHSVPQPHLPLEMDVTEPRSDWCRPRWREPLDHFNLFDCWVKSSHARDHKTHNQQLNHLCRDRSATLGFSFRVSGPSRGLEGPGGFTGAPFRCQLKRRPLFFHGCSPACRSVDVGAPLPLSGLPFDLLALAGGSTGSASL